MKLVRRRHAALADPDARGVRERDRRDRRRRAARRTACCTCSRSPHEVGHRAVELDDFDTIAARTPIVADLKPGGRYVATDLFKAGGVALVARELVRGGLVHEDARGVDGRTLARSRDGAFERPGPGGRRLVGRAAEADRRARDPARLARAGGLRRQARRPRAPAPPRPGARLRLRGGLLRRGQGARDRSPATSS